MGVRPVSVSGLVGELVEAISERPGRVRVAVDGADAARPWELADKVAEGLRVRRHVLRVSAKDFLRPASLRFEFGKQDPDSYYDGWLDVKGLTREVLQPLEPGGTGRVIPSLWDPEKDRATRAPYQELPPDAVVILDGPLLLGQGLPIDFSVHLSLSRGALRRRTEEEWTLPAFERYADEVRPQDWADVVVRVDDSRHPALVEIDP
ncbi:uridine kinase [Herbidospora mongoliensis]|uniref:uridine kinase n=1 Tax=Herbidospora mongoliensis TaxID=688067 RepID=UPI0008320936|nr:uridine kinase [Herbidospora mongoliensis]